MKHIKKYLIYISILLSSSPLFSQKNLTMGDNEFANNQYYKAIEYYLPYFNKKNIKHSEKANLAYKLGYCYKKLSLPEEASQYFYIAIENKYNDPIVYYYYGQTLQMQQKLEMALVQYKNFKELAPNHKYADSGIESIEFAYKTLNTPSRYDVKVSGALNSGEFDYCPFFEAGNNRKIYFTSTRYAPNHITQNSKTGDYCSNLYFSEQNKEGKWSVPKLVQGFVNTINEEGAASLNRRSSNIYFTRCMQDEKANKSCRIYFAKRSGNSWVQAQLVEIPGIPAEISIGHPAISDDELTLYFVADSLFGGYGGKDIYKVTRDKKTSNFGYPQNLGPYINTEKDEVYPYIRSNGDLYFSSDGHLGMGGLDIFRAKRIKGAEYDVVNLGSPINSTHDDFGIAFKGMREEGFFTSWRKGGMGKTDLFHFVMPQIEFTVSGKVWNKHLNTPIPNVDIQIMNDEYILMDSQITNEQGEFEIELQPENNYIIYFKAPDFKDVQKIEIETKSINETKYFYREVFFE